jgi:hypothetical protein
MTPHRVLMILLGGVAVCLAMIVLLWPDRADAQSRCWPIDQLLAVLQKTYGEQEIVRMKLPTGELVLTRAADGGWSIVRVAGQLGCLIAGGKQSTVERGI